MRAVQPTQPFPFLLMAPSPPSNMQSTSVAFQWMLALRQESLAAVSSALTLVSNIETASNTTKMQRTLENIEASRGQPIVIEQLTMRSGFC
jgi:hypothetical protein